MALARDQDDVVRACAADGFGNGGAAVADLRRARSISHDRATDRSRIFAARVIVGNNHLVRGAHCYRAHLGPLARVAIPARAEHRNELAPYMRAQRGNRGFERIGSVRVIDINRRACPADRRAFEPTTHGLKPGQRVESCRRIAVGGQYQPRRNQRVGRLICANQRQLDRAPDAAVLDLQFLPKLSGVAGEEANCFAPLAHREHAKTPLCSVLTSLVRPGIVSPDHRCAIVFDDLVEQPHFCCEVVFHRRVVIEMVAAEVGERSRLYGHAFVAELRQPVTRRLERDVGDALACQTREV